MYTDFLPVVIFTGLAIALVSLPLIIQHIISPRHNKGGEKLSSYECGEIPEGSAWVKFNVRFYIIALIFLIFDVEVIFLFPWAASLVRLNKEFSEAVLIEMFVFIGVLILGWFLAWKQKAIEWE